MHKFDKKPIQDDIRRRDIPWEEGIWSYAGGGPNTRTHHLFVTFQGALNSQLGHSVWERPLGYVTKETFGNAQKWYKGYGEMRAFKGE